MEMNDERPEMVRRMVHDLRSPLSVIKSFLTALDGDAIPDELKALHAAAKRSADKMIMITDNNVRVEIMRSDVA